MTTVASRDKPLPVIYDQHGSQRVKGVWLAFASIPADSNPSGRISSSFRVFGWKRRSTPNLQKLDEKVSEKYFLLGSRSKYDRCIRHLSVSAWTRRSRSIGPYSRVFVFSCFRVSVDGFRFPGNEKIERGKGKAARKSDSQLDERFREWNGRARASQRSFAVK